MARQRYIFTEYEGDTMEERNNFYDPGGRSSLRAGRRCYPCPTCGKPNKLTAKDKRLGYQCDTCADQVDRGY